jgi:hypothetical protein
VTFLQEYSRVTGREKGDIAQLGERRLCKPEVTGSIPVISTREISVAVVCDGADI